MTLRDMTDLELELNQVVDDVNMQIQTLKNEAAEWGKSPFDFKNQMGDPTMGPLLNVKANALHSLLICKGEH